MTVTKPPAVCSNTLAAVRVGLKPREITVASLTSGVDGPSDTDTTSQPTCPRCMNQYYMLRSYGHLYNVTQEDAHMYTHCTLTYTNVLYNKCTSTLYTRASSPSSRQVD